MVRGLDQFKKHFEGFGDRYVLIGGTASTMAMEALGQEFRATKDLDIVLCIEALDQEFAQRFWDFIKAGNYNRREKSAGERLFYRFSKPKDRSLPEVLELFSRVPDAIDLDGDATLTPIPVGEEVLSLSAILLDDGYYEFIHQRKRTVDGLPVVDTQGLIPLKARAYLDLANRRDRGENVDSRDVKKHKNDIFRLYTVLDRSSDCPLTERMKSDLVRSFEKIRQVTTDLKALGLPGITVEDVLRELENYYGLGD